MIKTTEFKMCTKCKVMIPLSTKRALCPKCAREQYQYKKDMQSVDERYRAANKVYGSSRYQKARAECKRNAKGMCEICYHFGRRKQGKETHHITKVLDGNDSTHYDIFNLIYVCVKCHKKIEGLSKEQLLAMLDV